MSQRALHHGPGRYRALFTFRAEDKGAVRNAAQQLLLHMQQVRDRPLYVLVAINPGALTAEQSNGLAKPDVPPNVDLLVQIAADGVDDLTFATRLVRFASVEQGRLQPVDVLTGTRRVLDRENFGFTEKAADLKEYDLDGAEDKGASRWLLFQRCEQDLSAFDRVAAGPAAAAALESHQQEMRQVELKEGKALRRSFAYEDVQKAGLAFLATAKEPAALQRLLERFQAASDPITRASLTRGQSMGYFVVPPNAAFFGAGQALPLPEWVTKFYRRTPIVQYDVTLKMHDFLFRTFHANARRIRDQNWTPRADLKLLTDSFIKLLLGYEVPKSSLQEQFLQRLASSQTAAGSSAAAMVVKPQTAQASAMAAQAPQRLLARASGAEIDAEIAETTVVHPFPAGQLDALSQLAAQAEQESYDAFKEAGDVYVTFSL